MCGLEQWKQVVGWEGLYEVSDQGRVRSVDRVVRHWRGGTASLKGRLKKLTPLKPGGHLIVNLHREGVHRSRLVHRVVMDAWVGPCPDDQEVCHGPKGVLDNSVGNLSYGTRSENHFDKRRDGTHNGKAVISSDGVEFINMHVAAEESECSSKNIWLVCNNWEGRKTTGGFGWEYA